MYSTATVFMKKKLSQHFKIFALLFLFIPYAAVFLNYGFLSITDDRYFRDSRNIFYSYLEDSSYLLLIQIFPRVYLLLIGMLLSEVLFSIVRYMNINIAFLYYSTFTGFVIGVVLSYFNVNFL